MNSDDLILFSIFKKNYIICLLIRFCIVFSCLICFFIVVIVFIEILMNKDKYLCISVPYGVFLVILWAFPPEI